MNVLIMTLLIAAPIVFYVGLRKDGRLGKATKCVSCEARKNKYINSGGIPSLYANRKKCKGCGVSPKKQ